MILALGVSILIFLLVGITAIILKGRGDTANLSLSSQQALYLAEGGIEYARGAVRQKAQQIVDSTTPKGITMPTLYFAEILAHLGATGDHGSGFKVGPKAVLRSDGKTVLGYFTLTISTLADSIGQRAAPYNPTLETPAGLGWQPILVIQSTGLAGPDSQSPRAQRRIVVTLRPLPPPMLAPAHLPPREALVDGDGTPREVAVEDLRSAMPTFGVPEYEISDYVDLGATDPHLWLLDESATAPSVYAPTSSLPDQSPQQPWWALP